MPPLMDLFANRPLKGPDDSLGFLLWRVTHAWQRFVADSDEAGRVFRFQAGQHSNMKPATVPI